MKLDVLVRKYFGTLDESIEKLSHSFEGKLSVLPKYVLSPRRIKIALIGDRGIALGVMPDLSLDDDVISVEDIKTKDELNNIQPCMHQLQYSRMKSQITARLVNKESLIFVTILVQSHNYMI